MIVKFTQMIQTNFMVRDKILFILHIGFIDINIVNIVNICYHPKLYSSYTDRTFETLLIMIT